MWRFMFLAGTAFIAGFLHSVFRLDPQTDWQIPTVVGLAVFLAMYTVPRPKPKMRKRVIGSHQMLTPRLNVDFIEGTNEKPLEKSSDQEPKPFAPNPRSQHENSISLDQ